jgi:hypothetical protein
MGDEPTSICLYEIWEAICSPFLDIVQPWYSLICNMMCVCVFLEIFFIPSLLMETMWKLETMSVLSATVL